MCFEIDRTIKSHDKTIVYKIVGTRNDYGVPMLCSPYHRYRGHERYAQYVVGRWTKMRGKRMSQRDEFLSRRACAGIYVYLTRAVAIKEHHRVWSARHEHTRLVRCKVDPKDFLFSDGYGTATYRKVKVISSRAVR